MSADKNIEKLFKERFEHFEAPFSSKVWANVSASISQTALATSTVASAGAAGSMSWAAAGLIFAMATFGIANSADELAKQNRKSDELVTTENTTQKPTNNQTLENNKTANTSDENSLSQDDGTRESTISNSNINSISKTEILTDKQTDFSSEQNAEDVPVEYKRLSQEAERQRKNETKQNAETTKKNEDLLNNSFRSTIVANPLGGIAPITVEFSCTEDLKGAKWNFGDNSEDAESNNPIHIYTNPGTYTVTLIAQPVNGKVFMDYIQVQVDKDPNEQNSKTVNASKIETPNVLTPNYDGINDDFKVKAKHIRTFSIHIYNTNGLEVFHSNNVDETWNGKDKDGNDCSSGTYYYQIIAEGEDGKQHAPKGHITLIR